MRYASAAEPDQMLALYVPPGTLTGHRRDAPGRDAPVESLVRPAGSAD
ncbi:MAG: hypothetical protein HY074_00980 [Deltaproteobacteria bacterium]|nr:hypothetical protein [Deltaproteobacteria bacterium]